MLAPVISSPGVATPRAHTSVYTWTARRASALVELARYSSRDPEREINALVQLTQTCVDDPRTGYLFALRLALHITGETAWTLTCGAYADLLFFFRWIRLLQRLPSTVLDHETTNLKLPLVQTWLTNIENAGPNYETEAVDTPCRLAIDSLNAIFTSSKEKFLAWKIRCSASVTHDDHPSMYLTTG